MVADQAVLSSWRSVVGSLEDDARVSARLMGFVYLAQPQGLIGNTLLLAVPNETTRETLQGTQVADALQRILAPRGVIVVMECEHLCMTMRGVRKPGAKTVTSAVRGQLRDPSTRSEAMSLILNG